MQFCTGCAWKHWPIFSPQLLLVNTHHSLRQGKFVSFQTATCHVLNARAVLRLARLSHRFYTELFPETLLPQQFRRSHHQV